MPPRIPLFQCLRTQNVAQSTSCPRTLSASSSRNASTVTQRRRHQDPYAIAQAKARKAANLSRQEVLKKERAAALGDPVRGITTPYVQSFDAIPAQEPSAPLTSTKTRTSSSPDSDAPGPQAERDEHLNFFLNKPELDAGLEYSKWLATPSEASEALNQVGIGNQDVENARSKEEQQDTASEALRRIASLSIGSSQDRARVNTQRCIADFGRHNTDTSLPPRPQPAHPPPTDSLLAKTPRMGPDTGSSEVQIAILTSKIKALADFVETRGTMDKANKRNLRLLVHRRAKLLKYLHRKERGGPRFQNLVEILGLTEGTWRGEITIMGPMGGHSPVRLQKLLAKGT